MDVARRVTDAVYDRASGVVIKDRRGLELRAKASTAWRIVKASFPAVEGIVVAVADKGADAGLVQLLQTGNELELGAQAPVGRIVYITGNEQCIDTFVNTELDDVLICAERRAVQGGSSHVREQRP